MISYLIDVVLVGALAVTGWRTGAMVRELRTLRTAEASFNQSLKAADGSIDRAAHAVVMLRSEGVRTLAALEARIQEARLLSERLDEAVRSAELSLALANDNASGASPASAADTNWLQRIESRLASASAVNR